MAHEAYDLRLEFQSRTHRFLLEPGISALFIRIFLPISDRGIHWPYSFFLRKRRVNFTQNLFIGVVLQLNRVRCALRVAETISLTEDRVDLGLSPLRGFIKLYGTIGARGDACPTGNAFILIHFAHGTGGDHDVTGEKC
jgi:hypothetical protein